MRWDVLPASMGKQRARMNIPQKADKWIAFMLILALGRVEYSRSTGIHFAPVEWLVGSVVIAVLLTIRLCVGATDILST
jgi:hypothetical protein